MSPECPSKAFPQYMHSDWLVLFSTVNTFWESIHMWSSSINIPLIIFSFSMLVPVGYIGVFLNFDVCKIFNASKYFKKRVFGKKKIFRPNKKSALFFKRSTSEIGPKISLLIFSFRKIIFTDSCGWPFWKYSLRGILCKNLRSVSQIVEKLWYFHGHGQCLFLARRHLSATMKVP